MQFFGKRSRRIAVVTLLLISGLQLPGSTIPASQAQPAGSGSAAQANQTWTAYLPLIDGVRTNAIPAGGYVQRFDGDPTVPTPWHDPNWDITVHTRDVASLTAMSAQHGSDCGAPSTSHAVTTYAESVFLCRNHVMTAINGANYGAIYMTPNQMLDFSAGEAVIQFDISTLRTSQRDWFDVWITPYEDNLQLPLEDWLPDMQGEPRRAVHVRLTLTGPNNEMGMLSAAVVRDFNYQQLPNLGDWNGYEKVLIPDSARRDTFEIRMSNTTLLVGMPKYDLWWVDTTFEDLGWNKGIVQFGHHSYNPTKCSGCQPNTWHWDNIVVAPAIPFTIINAEQDSTGGVLPIPITFPTPAPANAHLRFAGIGSNIEVSYDGGATWSPAQLQKSERQIEDHVASYWTPIPQGTQQVLIRGADWSGGNWYARDITIWAP